MQIDLTTIDLTTIIKALIVLVVALVARRLIPWIQSKTTAQQQANLRAMVNTLVYAAEQVFGAGNGREKLEYVCGQLEEMGFRVDLAEIEAAVYQAFNNNIPMLRPGAKAEAEDETKTGTQNNAPPDDAAEGREE